MKSIGYYNGSYSELSDMYVPMNDRACFFGDGVYDAAYCYNHKIFALEEHVARFFQSAKGLGIEPRLNHSALTETIQRLVEKVNDDKLFVYWQATRGTQERSHTYDAQIKSNLWITVKHGELRDINTPISVALAEDYRHLYCNIKSLNLLPNIMALQQAELSGKKEVIFHRNGRITECGHSNVFIIKNQTLITPPADRYILPGIARAQIIRLANKAGIRCEEREFFLDELINSDEIFLTAAGSLCIAVADVDGQRVGGRDATTLRQLRKEMVDEFNAFTGAQVECS